MEPVQASAAEGGKKETSVTREGNGSYVSRTNILNQILDLAFQ
jgi:hypothetical protein